ncbi:ATP-binding cassette domain-containing protein [Actinoplanes sp. NPDC049265]|uniref:ATP-binding cassette domain-containing protein n=1 Tax=Actinoplanes sp. NPDC049265 TaxID=3363902 RepID=UPI003720D5EB
MRVIATGVSVSIDGTPILDDVSFDAATGRVTGLVGPNGSGKSTLLRCLYRIIRPRQGAVLIGGDDVWRVPARRAGQLRAVVAQDQELDNDYSVRDIVSMGRIPHQRLLVRESAADRAIVDGALERAGIAWAEHRRFATLSGGERQRVLLARALAQDAPVLLLDEPTNHLDIGAQLELLDLIRELRLTTVAALHDLDHAVAYCDAVVLLEHGRVVAAGRPVAVLTPERLAEVFGVRAAVLTHPLTGRPHFAFATAAARPGPERTTNVSTHDTFDEPVPDARLTAPLDPPATGAITVAFLLSSQAELVDFAGPWGVFEYAQLDDRPHPFTLYTVAATTDPVRVSGGMVLVPGHDFESAPAPDIVVVPAVDMEKIAPEALDWLRRVHHDAAVTMSVCNGSFVLGRAGLLDGRTATAHHAAYKALGALFPEVEVVRGVRFVEDGPIATAGGLTSGTDLALRIVERYFGRAVAQRTATYLEYQGTGWTHPGSNAEFASMSSPEQPACPVCDMPTTSSFCGDWCREQYQAAPERFSGAARP